jgi:hypothetical protein
MTTATVKYISNGYIVTGGEFPPSVPQPLYAATIPEVVYWLGRIFDPIVLQEPLTFSKAPEPHLIAPINDPLLNQLATVGKVASGGYLVTQIPSIIGGAGQPIIDVYCVNLDAVAQVLTVIYTPPAE